MFSQYGPYELSLIHVYRDEGMTPDSSCMETTVTTALRRQHRPPLTHRYMSVNRRETFSGLSPL